MAYKHEKTSDLLKFAEFGKLSSGLFHDLINPLAAISLYIDDLASSKAPELPEELRKKLQATLSASRKMEAFVASVKKQLSHASGKERFSIKKEIVKVTELLSPRIMNEQASVKVEGKSDAYAYGNSLRFNQVFLNVISNALDAYKQAHKGNARKIEINIRRCYRSKTPHAEIAVRDYATGIHPHIQDKIFRPFFSTKDPHDSSGIGLYITREILEQEFRGTIKATSAPTPGALFIITVPIMDAGHTSYQ